MLPVYKEMDRLNWLKQSLVCENQSVGRSSLLGEDITKASPRQITEMGSAHVPEDRQADGLVLPFSVAENLVLCTYYKEPFSKGVILQYKTILDNSKKLD